MLQRNSQFPVCEGVFMKKKMVIGIIVAVVLCGGYFIGSGFLRNGSVDMDGYSISGDGREITLDIGVAASRGYIRKMEISQQMGGKLYIDCYAAFGGINGRIGAKNSFTLPLDEDTTMIGIYRNENCYEEILHKDADGSWQRTKANG